MEGRKGSVNLAKFPNMSCLSFIRFYIRYLLFLAKRCHWQG